MANSDSFQVGIKLVDYGCGKTLYGDFLFVDYDKRVRTFQEYGQSYDGWKQCWLSSGEESVCGLDNGYGAPLCPECLLRFIW